MRIQLNTLMFVCFLFFNINVQAQNDKNEIVLASDDWCPMTCVENNKQGRGLVTDIVEEALKGTSYRFRYKMINWARAIEMAKKNEIQGILGAYKSDVPDFLFSDKPQVTSHDCFYGLVDKKWKYENFDSLIGKKVGIINGYSYGEQLDEYKNSDSGKKIFFETSGDEPLMQNLNKLLTQRLDLILENELVINYNKIAGDSSYKKLDSYGCLSSKEIYAAFNKVDPRNADVVRIISKFMNSKNGQKKIKELIKKYLVNKK